MRWISRIPLLPLLVSLLCFSLAAPGSGWAAFVPSASLPQGAEGEELAALRGSLENDLIRARLEALGVSREEALARLASLSPGEREQVAAGLSSLQAGGEVQVFIAFEGVVAAPVLIGLLFLWLMVLAFSSR